MIAARFACAIAIGTAVACGHPRREPVGAAATCDQVVDHMIAIMLASPDAKRTLDALPAAAQARFRSDLAAKRPDMLRQCKAKRFSQDVLACSLRAADERALDACERGTADGAHPAVHAMEQIAAEICACGSGDLACLELAQRHAAAFMKTYGDARGSDADRKALDAATRHMTDCLAKQNAARADAATSP